MGGFEVVDSASCYYTFLEGAVFFTACFLAALNIRLVKNKALGESFNLEGWLPAQLKPLTDFIDSAACCLTIHYIIQQVFIFTVYAWLK